jgi:hypothetical protein
MAKRLRCWLAFHRLVEQVMMATPTANACAAGAAM